MDRWSHTRAALIGLALLAHGIYALPLPKKVTSKDIEDEAHQRDLELWLGWFGAVGLPVTHDGLEVFVVDATAALQALHDGLKKPFRPMFDLLGANQAWALFASATTKPERLVVEIQRRGSAQWEPILRRLDPCCPWKEPVLEYRRIRGIWDGQGEKMRPGYKGLTKWIARRAFEEYPDAVRVRVHLERGISTYPWEPDDPTTETKLQRVHRREAME